MYSAKETYELVYWFMGWLREESIIVTCARHRTLCTGSICPFCSCPPMCVCIILHMCIHAHPCSVTPPSTRKGSVSLYAHNHTDQNIKRLKQNLPRSLHTYLDTFNNGMFQGQRSRENARMRAHLETCLPRAHLFIGLWGGYD